MGFVETAKIGLMGLGLHSENPIARTDANSAFRIQSDKGREVDEIVVLAEDYKSKSIRFQHPVSAPSKAAILSDIKPLQKKVSPPDPKMVRKSE